MTIDKPMSIPQKVSRYVKAGNTIAGIVTRVIGEKYLHIDTNKNDHALTLVKALGNLKGPMMKIAQLLSTVPGSLPDEYMDALASLQSNAPAMGWLFVKRRMSNELGGNWQEKFEEFEKRPFAAASLGQVHMAKFNGKPIACKLQYPDMLSQVELDMNQFKSILKLYEKIDSSLMTDNIFNELRDRILEELDYEIEASNIDTFKNILVPLSYVTVPSVIPEITTKRLLCMQFLAGKRVDEFTYSSQDIRNIIAERVFTAWYYPLFHSGYIHGDPHMGNYTIDNDLKINLLDFGCVRKFPQHIVNSVLELYRATLHKDRDRAVAAYQSWGFTNLNNELIDALNIWAEFLYHPLIEDKIRTIHQHHNGKLGRDVIMNVIEAVRKSGGVTPPREFVLIDRAAVGVGAMAMHLRAELNWHQLFESIIDQNNKYGE